MSSIWARQHYHSTGVPTNAVELTPELARADLNLLFLHTRDRAAGEDVRGVWQGCARRVAYPVFPKRQ